MPRAKFARLEPEKARLAGLDQKLYEKDDRIKEREDKLCDREDRRDQEIKLERRTIKTTETLETKENEIRGRKTG